MKNVQRRLMEKLGYETGVRWKKPSIRRIPIFIAMLLMPVLAEAQNLVANGDFESGYTNGWNHLAGGGGVATYSDETTAPYEGSHALKSVIGTLGSNSWSIQSMGPSVALTVGEEYTLTFWGKAASAGTSISMIIQNTVWTGKSYSLGTEWTQYSWTFTAKENSPSIRIWYTQVGTVWIDDVQLEAVIPQTGPIDVTLTPTTRYQTMDGFGGALTWYSSWIHHGNAASVAAFNQLVFEDLGLDVLRLKNWYYPTNYPTNKDPSGLDEAFASSKKFYDAAKAANSNIQVLLSSWSPPESLKSNGALANGGTLTKDGNGNYQYAELAQYYVDLLDNLGWTPDYLSFQNEPGWEATWESCIFRPTETASNAGYAEAADAVWNAIKDRPNVPKMIGSESENIGSTTWPDWNGGSSVNTFRALNTPLKTRSYVNTYAYHVYNVWATSQIDSATTIQNFNMVRDEFGDRPNWMTEFSSADFDWIQAGRVIHNALVEANASAYVYWTLVWNNSSSAMIDVQWDGSYTVGNHFYTIKHYAKHVDKGYQRFDVGGSDGNVKVSGYISPDNSSITIVAINKATETKQIQLVHDSLPIISSQGYQSVAGSFYQAMAGLDETQPIDLPAQSMTTLVLTLATPEMSVRGNSTEIASGDTEPSPDDDTSFGTVTVGDAAAHTFTIANTGNGNLSLGGSPIVSISGGAGFSVTTQPGSSTVSPSGELTFIVTFEPASSGNQTATVSIANNDADENPYIFVVGGTGLSGGPIVDVSLRNGLTIIGYTGENAIDAATAFGDLITAGQLVNVRWIDPANGFTKELYESPVFGWVNDIGNLTLGEGYIVRTNAQCTLSISGNKSTASVIHDLRVLSIVGFNQETPLDAEVAFADLIAAEKLLNVRWIDADGFTQELYESPVFGWVNDIGDLVEGQGYIIKLTTTHDGFTLP